MSTNAVRSLRRELDHASDYAVWQETARELDGHEGGEAWKQELSSDDYDQPLIGDRLARMRVLRQGGDVRQLVFHLNEHLHGNIGNIANPALYEGCRVGTKRLIEEYVEEVACCLDYVCVGEFEDFDDDDKVLFFKRAGHGFGRSALLLSGGGALGLFHLGVVKALWEQRLLPRVLTGSSAGSLIASMVGTRTDVEMPEIFDAEAIDLKPFRRRRRGQDGQAGSLMDPAQLEACLMRNVRAGSFLQAFERTRRILGVTVSPLEANQPTRLINYLTAPHVLVHRAVLASCAVPGVFPPVMLRALDYDGNEVPHLRSKRWIDGSVSNDLPLLRLARLHNVNHYIVSQTNPHIVPFMRRANRKLQRGLLPFAREVTTTIGRDALSVTRRHLGGTGPFGAARMIDRINDILRQRYIGDINIYPHQSPHQLVRMFANPTAEALRRYIRQGERAAWPQLERIRLQTRISQSFEACLAWLKERGVYGPAAGNASQSSETGSRKLRSEESALR